MIQPTLSHNLSVCFRSSDIPWHIMSALWPFHCEVRVLRTLDDGSVRSAVARLKPGDTRDRTDKIKSTVQGYILSGSFTLGENVLTQGGFFAIPSGSAIPALTCNMDTEVLLIFDSREGLAENIQPVFLSRAIDIDPIEPVINGESIPGFERRVLWEDPETGADTRLLRIPAGFEGKGPNWHPVHEEIFCLEGDIGPDDTRLMAPGSYLHNKAFGVHGYHEHSNKGATVLEWHDGRWAINFV